MLTGADEELGLLAPRRQRRGAAERVAEAADLVDQRAAHGHVGADEVAHRAGRGAVPDVGAADDPVELGREPGRPTGLETGDDPPADTEDTRVRVRCEQAAGPAGTCGGVVVEERDDRPRRCRDAGVARAGEPLSFRVRDDGDVGELVGRAREQRVVVVDHEDDLVGCPLLGAHRLDRGGQIRPPRLGVGADDDGQRVGRRRHCTPRIRAPLSDSPGRWTERPFAFHGGCWVGRAWRCSGAMRRSVPTTCSSAHSVPIDRRTRKPSRTVRRLVVPEMRIYSKLGTSAMLRPARTARMWMTVSTSKPRNGPFSTGSTSRQKAV